MKDRENTQPVEPVQKHPVDAATRIAKLEEIAKAKQIELPPVTPQPKTNLPGFSKLGQEPVFKVGPKPFKNLLKLWHVNRLPITLAVITIVANSILTTLMTKTVGDSLDIGLKTGFSSELRTSIIWLVTLILLTGLMIALSGFFTSASWNSSYQRSTQAIYLRILNRILSVRKRFTSGETLTVLNADLYSQGHMVASAVELIGSLVTLIMVTVLMLQTSIPLALVAFIGTPLILGILSLVIPKLQSKQASQRNVQGNLMATMTDMLSGLRVLRGLGGEAQMQATFNATNQSLKTEGIKVATYQSLLKVLERNLPSLLLIAIIGYGTILVFDGKLTAGQLLAFYGYALLLKEPVRAFSWFFSSASRAWIGAKKYTEIASAPSVISDQVADDTSWELDWKTAQIRETQSQTDLKPGCITALVCADPTATAQLLAQIGRLEDSENVFFNQVPTVQIPIQTLREHLIFSGAENHLFAGTLRDNVLGPRRRPQPAREVKEDIYEDTIENTSREQTFTAYPWPHADDAQIRQALHLADAHDVLSGLAGELDGLVSERGRSVSGGQRQRIALARALYLDPDILLLVEPTSAVDSHTESRIAQNLKAARKGKTTVLVTSSPIMLEICDEVVVYGALGKENEITQLRVLGTGTHAELLSGTHPAAREYQAVVSRAMGESDAAENAEGGQR